MTSAQVNIVWFRQDLRISDNPALPVIAPTGNGVPEAVPMLHH
ncbi:MAG: deoxyribodipyrimidine photo-lyase [Gammaproteobacteria bacterium]|nr:deoxyribodipyrimidine photo-lyase [Gammaproteobacteria bacterium]